ncbi:hypothetical protein PSH81_18400 [Pseudomonas sp. FP2335]|uniref:hypothetical protein n=1 Tax=Pseudomonas sp. FP2335 TaxID=2954092 RepID=UPI0027338C00|nr:hypothetical protein [Pseudomonas sp. FP2335]WLH77696.1 hypothetical protein PSH81_18400 [Pseudomonas sp. FP2335]
MLTPDSMVKILKGLIVFPQRVNLAGAVLALFAVLVVFNNEAAFAGEGSITQSTAPGPVLILSNADTVPAVGFSNFYATSSEFPAVMLLPSVQHSRILYGHARECEVSVTR